jgi:glycosyltransferase involved in cell wall biosynthesis
MFFEKSHIFVFPTFYYYECFPLVLLEAMQHALPVISTDEGGIPDIAETGITGYIVAK